MVKGYLQKLPVLKIAISSPLHLLFNRRKTFLISWDTVQVTSSLVLVRTKYAYLTKPNKTNKVAKLWMHIDVVKT